MDEIRITGEVESIIYQNADNGYTVLRWKQRMTR